MPEAIVDYKRLLPLPFQSFLTLGRLSLFFSQSLNSHSFYSSVSSTYTFALYIPNSQTETFSSGNSTHIKPISNTIKMSKIFNTAVLLAGLVAQVSGHTSVESAEIGGVTYPGFRGATIDAPLEKNSPAWKTNQVCMDRKTVHRCLFTNACAGLGLPTHHGRLHQQSRYHRPQGCHSFSQHRRSPCRF